MAGFFLYVSNTSLSTFKTQAHLCFHDQGIKPIFDEQRIVCSVLGRYVIYYNERPIYKTYLKNYSTFAFYELCELEVYGEKYYINYNLNDKKYFLLECVYFKD